MDVHGHPSERRLNSALLPFELLDLDGFGRAFQHEVQGPAQEGQGNPPLKPCKEWPWRSGSRKGGPASILVLALPGSLSQTCKPKMLGERMILTMKTRVSA